jgi:hypothetical protein
VVDAAEAPVDEEVLELAQELVLVLQLERPEARRRPEPLEELQAEVRVEGAAPVALEDEAAVDAEVAELLPLQFPQRLCRLWTCS